MLRFAWLVWMVLVFLHLSAEGSAGGREPELVRHAGNEFLSVSVPPPGLQSHPALAAAGGFTYAVWTDGRVAGESRVYWTRLSGGESDSLAAPATLGTAAEVRPAVGAGDDWGVAVWEAWEGGGVGIRAAELPAQGLPGPGSWSAVTAGPGPVWRPHVAVRGEVAVLVWEDERAAPGDLYFSRWGRGTGALDPGGLPLAAGSPDQRWPRIAAGGGGFVVVWSEGPGGGSAYGVMALALDPNGTPVYPAIEVSGSTGAGLQPEVARAGDRFLVVWQDSVAGGVLRGRFLDSAGAPLGPGPVLLVDSPALEYGAHLGGLSEGFTLTWTEADGSGRMVRRARVDTLGGVHPPGGVPVTGPEAYAADATVAARADTVRVVWRVPRPEDEDDLYMVRVAGSDTSSVPEPVPLTLVTPSSSVGGVSTPEPGVGLRVFPNPFRGTLLVQDPAASPGDVLEVYDVRGRRVTRVGLERRGGSWSWDGSGPNGVPVPPGVYLIRRSGSRASARVVLIP